MFGREGGLSESLFDSDAHESVEAFTPLLDDKDIWFRNKAIEAYRRWAPKHAPHLLVELAQSSELDGQRCVATVLESIKNPTEAAKLARFLLKSNDDVVVRRASTNSSPARKQRIPNWKRFKIQKIMLFEPMLPR